MKRNATTLTAALALAGTLGLSACGSNDSGAAGSGAAPATSAAPSQSMGSSPSESMAPSESMSPSMAPSQSMSPSMAPTSGSGAAMAQFGSACAKVPTDGPGSFAGMAKDPVATAAGNNPLLSTLAGAVMKAGLADTLNSAKDVTVFAPADAAFAKVDKAMLGKVLADKKALTGLLTYHVVPGRLSPEQVAGSHKTLAGQTLQVMGSGENFTVGKGKAKVLCGNVQTANATVYIVDGVLMP